MAQQIGDLLESGAALHHPTGNRMSQDVGSANTVLKATAPSGVANCIADDVHVGRRIVGRPMTYEQLAPGRLWPSVTQIVHNRSTRGIG